MSHDRRYQDIVQPGASKRFAPKAPSLLHLKDLRHRVAFILAVLSGQQCQTIQNLSIDHMTIEDSKITFVIVENRTSTATSVRLIPYPQKLMCHNLLIGVFETYIIPSRSTQIITYKFC